MNSSSPLISILLSETIGNRITCRAIPSVFRLWCPLEHLGYEFPQRNIFPSLGGRLSLIMFDTKFHAILQIQFLKRSILKEGIEEVMPM